MAFQFDDLNTGVGHLKMGLQGFQGSGKTWTAKKVAVGLIKHLKLEGGIAMLDTEASAQYIAPSIFKETGLKLIGKQTRALGVAVEFLKACEIQKVSVAIIDSVTHLWRECCESYLNQINAKLIEKNRGIRTRLEFQDWAPLKKQFGELTDLYLNSPMHIIICGRAGYDWDFVERDDGSGKKDLVKTGKKMKTEGEFGHEPSLSVEMERVHARDAQGNLVGKVVHRATILKDRFDEMDGRFCDNPDYEFFKPFIDRLTPGAHAKVDTKAATDHQIDEEGDAKWRREKRDREIFCEKIKNVMMKFWPGMSAVEKAAKLDVLEQVFGTNSWTEIETRVNSQELGAGHSILKETCENKVALMAKKDPPHQPKPRTIKDDKAKPEKKETPGEKLAAALPVAGGAKKGGAK